MGILQTDVALIYKYFSSLWINRQMQLNYRKNQIDV